MVAVVTAIFYAQKIGEVNGANEACINSGLVAQVAQSDGSFFCQQRLYDNDGKFQFNTTEGLITYEWKLNITNNTLPKIVD